MPRGKLAESISERLRETRKEFEEYDRHLNKEGLGAEDAERLKKDMEAINAEIVALENFAAEYSDFDGAVTDDGKGKAVTNKVGRRQAGENRLATSSLTELSLNGDSQSRIISASEGELRDKQDKVLQLLEEHIKTYKDGAVSGKMMGWAGLILSLASGAAGLTVSLVALFEARAQAEKPDGPPAAPVHPLLLRENLAAAGPASGEPGLDKEELQETFAELIANQGLIESGAIEQGPLWQSLSRTVQDRPIEAQRYSLLFIREALADLPESQDFFWEDGQQIKDRYQRLFGAYKKSGKIGDMYGEAVTLGRAEPGIPFYHMALLLSYCLALIKHEQTTAP